MANLFFPQLVSGALSQYPIKKAKSFRTIQNTLSDGNVILYSDPNGCGLSWELFYTELSSADVRALQAHFNACLGAFRGFTFIDPTGNMLACSSNLIELGWRTDPLLQLSGGVGDPNGGGQAFTIRNNGQVSASIKQSLIVPSNYQYCFSIYTRSVSPTAVRLQRSGSVETAATSFQIGPRWGRLISSGRLNDPGTILSVGVEILPGQQIELYGPQLEAQIAPSPYRPTTTLGGVYANAHWATDRLSLIADGPNSFSTEFRIETAI